MSPDGWSADDLRWSHVVLGDTSDPKSSQRLPPNVWPRMSSPRCLFLDASSYVSSQMFAPSCLLPDDPHKKRHCLGSRVGVYIHVFSLMVQELSITWGSIYIPFGGLWGYSDYQGVPGQFSGLLWAALRPTTKMFNEWVDFTNSLFTFGQGGLLSGECWFAGCFLLLFVVSVRQTKFFVFSLFFNI